jgi:hypothetical protein
MSAHGAPATGHTKQNKADTPRTGSAVQVTGFVFGDGRPPVSQVSVKQLLDAHASMNCRNDRPSGLSASKK